MMPETRLGSPPFTSRSIPSTLRMTFPPSTISPLGLTWPGAGIDSTGSIAAGLGASVRTFGSSASASLIAGPISRPSPLRLNVRLPNILDSTTDLPSIFPGFSEKYLFIK